MRWVWRASWPATAERRSVTWSTRALCAELGDLTGEARATGATAAVYQRQGDYRRAEELFLEALGTLSGALGAVPETAAGDGALEAVEGPARERERQRGVVLGNLGTLYKNMGRRDQAAQKNSKAMRVFRDIRDLRQIGTSLNNLAALRSELFGDAPGARKAFSAALQLFRTLRDRHGEMISLLGLARELANAGKHAEAEERARELVALCKELGDVSTRGWALHVLGSARLGQDDPAGADRLFQETLSLSGDTQDSRLGIMAKTGLGRAVLADDDPAGALDCFEEGLKEALALPWPLMVGQLLFEKARALDALGRRQEALAAAEEAVESREDLGASEIGGVRDWISERRRKPPPDAGLTDGQ